MQLAGRAHLVGSGRLGLTMTDVYDCNVYLVDGGSELALIDAGSGYRVDALLASIERAGFDLDRVTTLLLTHKHADHSGGAAAIRATTELTIYASLETATAVADGERFTANLARAKKSGAYPSDYVFAGVAVDEIVGHGDRVVVGDLTLEILETPGHCAGHCSVGYQADARSVLATGDALLPFGQIVVQPIADCSVPETVSSIEMLAASGWDILLPGHLGPVLSEASWHIQSAVSRVSRGQMPQSLYIPDA